MGYFFTETVRNFGHKKVVLTSRLSEKYVEGKRGLRYVIASPFAVDQTLPGSFINTVTAYLDSKDKDYVIYHTVDSHAVSTNPLHYINLSFEDWLDGLHVALDYQPSNAPKLKGLTRAYKMNVGVGPSLAGWLFTKAAERGQPSARNLAAVLLGAPAFNFLQGKLNEILNETLWTEQGPDFIADLMKTPFCTSPDGQMMSYKFAKSSVPYEVDVESPYYTDAAVKLFPGMQDKLVDYEQTITFSKHIVSPIEPQVFLTPNGVMPLLKTRTV